MYGIIDELINIIGQCEHLGFQKRNYSTGLVILEQVKTAAGRCLASMISLQLESTAEESHHEQAASELQEFSSPWEVLQVPT
jgi:hypothetical protein